ncbi:MAG TPA: hypothetical protein VHN36_05840, partial [Ilumatobacteraceae bacterium]|nr:hypothetical protein [Ilumatobacteraceae bacterium]
QPCVDSHCGLDAEGASDDVAARMRARLVFADVAGVDQLLHVAVVDVLQGVEPTTADTGLESEPGWPGSDSTSTMIDADADSFLTPVAVGVAGADAAAFAAPGDAAPSGGWGKKRFLKLLGAAAVLTVIVTLIAVAVRNGDDNKLSPTTTVAVTEPGTVPSTSPTSSTSSTSSTTSTSNPNSTTAGANTSGP